MSPRLIYSELWSAAIITLFSGALLLVGESLPRFWDCDSMFSISPIDMSSSEYWRASYRWFSVYSLFYSACKIPKFIWFNCMSIFRSESESDESFSL